MTKKQTVEWPGPLAKRAFAVGRMFCATTTVDSEFIPSSQKRAKGVYLYDFDGRRFMDFCSGVGVANCGHGVKEIERAIAAHLRKTGRLQFIHTDFYCPEAIELSYHLFSEVMSSLGVHDHYKVFLSNSGAEANEAGLKLVFSKRPERKKVLCFDGGFHGRTLGVLPLLWKEHCRKGYPVAYEVKRLTFPCLGSPQNMDLFIQELDALAPVAKDYNVLVMEMVQGQGGIRVLDPVAALIIRQFCRDHHIYLMVDEVQTGYGRTGTFLAVEQYPVLCPDIITLAKGIANGFPLAATVFREDLDWTELGRHSNSFGGNALGAATALATLDYIKSHELSKNALTVGKRLAEALEEFSKKYAPRVANPRGLGLMRAVDFLDEKGKPDKALRHRVIQEGYRLGLILMDAGDAAIRVMPPLVITIAELDKGLKLLDQAIANALK